MKKLTILIAAMFMSAGLLAQSNKEDIDMLQSIFGKEKKQIVSGFVQLQGAQGDAFWRLYDAYETERKALGKQRIDLLERYATNYGTMDDVQMDKIMKDIQSLQAKTDKLIVKYYGKMKKEAGVKAASQFYELEGYFLSVIRCTILENIPFIGELDEKW
jgi:hypothetical protein